ncbi:MAG: Uma2 family endonuclease [Treponema sp.]|jgi:Uma2 family endonuclease|nr:Uma2 family endonuclease [Treponema sp.]
MADLALAYDDVQTWTYKDYKEWELKPGERFELIDGIAYAMAAPNTEHQGILSTLHGEFYIFLKGKKCRPFAAPFDVRLFYEEDESDDTVVQPDLVVVCDPKKLGKEGCRGAPDLAVEILSPSNTAIEMHRKLNLYREAGVREYWIIDPEEKIAEIYCLEGDRYMSRILHSGDALKSAQFPGLEISLDLLFAVEAV